MAHRLFCVLAHPDDESLGMGGVLARYAAEGVETYLATATSGERGWPGAPRLDVHFWWNLGEIGLLLPAAHVSMRRR